MTIAQERIACGSFRGIFKKINDQVMNYGVCIRYLNYFN